MVVASAADDDEAVLAGDVAAVEVTRRTKRWPLPPLPFPTPLPLPLTFLASSPLSLSLITADRALTLSRGSQRQACACARARALRECHSTPLRHPPRWQMNHATLSDDEGEEVYVVACEAE